MAAIREMHGLSWENGVRTPLYRLWLNMRNRCNNPNTPDFRYYGGRGIKVCKRWDRFVLFAADVGPHPGKGWTLDRINPARGYSPSNVRWANRATQSQNRSYCRLDIVKVRKIRLLYKKGARQVDLADMFGCSQTTISKVVRNKTWRE